MANSFVDEINKIPPVTRFLVLSLIGVTVPTLLQMVPAFNMIFYEYAIWHKNQWWRLYTTFFLGSSGIGFIFDLVMFYRASTSLEENKYPQRSPTYAWQVLLVALCCLAAGLPLKLVVHHRALFLALTYLESKLAPPGASTSLYGLVSFKIVYWPWVLVGIDMLSGGPGGAKPGLLGCLVAHVWWLAAFNRGGIAGQGFAKKRLDAPQWVNNFVGQGRGEPAGPPPPPGRPSHGETLGGGVSVVNAPAGRSTRDGAEGSSTGYQWGTGNRLGNR